MLRVLEVASSALAILLFQRLPSVVIAYKEPALWVCRFGNSFLQHSSMGRMEKAFF